MTPRHLFVLTVTLLSFPQAAGAQTAPAVVVLEMLDHFPQEAWPQAERRVAAELGIIGLRVVHATAVAEDAGTRLEELRRLSERHDAVAVIRIARQGRSGDVDVWLNDRVTGKTVLRTLPRERLRRPDAAALVALRVVELLHASLIEIRVHRQPLRDRPIPQAVIRIVDGALEGRRDQQSRFYAGAQGVFPIGSLGNMGGLTIGGTLFLPDLLLGLDVELAGTPLMATVADSRGSADVGFATLRAHLFYEPWVDNSVSPALGLGGGALLSWALGNANPGFEARNEASILAVASARLRVAIELAGPLRLLLAVTYGWHSARTRVRFDGNPIASTHQVLDGLIALEW